MSEENQYSRREEMLARFRESMRLPMTERYFDEDELIDIFDYAGDINDDYIRIEVLMCASRFYPDSEDLLQRKAIFYSQFADDMRGRCVDDNASQQGMIWDIMRARDLYSAPHAEKCKVLHTIMMAYDDYTDEEVIQFVDLADFLGEIPWLKENFEELRNRVGYLNILLYEAAVAADNSGDTSFSIELLEELTGIDAFSPDYWLMLAREYGVANDYEKAMQAIDYSLAINPDDSQALFIKGRLMYCIDRPNDEVIEVLEKAVRRDPTSEIVRFLGSIYYADHQPQKAKKLLQDYLSVHPEDSLSIVPDLLLLRPDNSKHLIEEFYFNNVENSQIIWVSWAQQLSLNGFPDVAKLVIDTYQRLSGNKVDTFFTIEDLFNSRKFDEVIESLSSIIDETNPFEPVDSAKTAVYIVSLIKAGKYGRALAICYVINQLDLSKLCTTTSGKLEYMGLLKITQDIQHHLEANDSDVDKWAADYDPFDIWS